MVGLVVLPCGFRWDVGLASSIQAEMVGVERSRGGRWWALDLLDNRFPALHGLRVLAILTVVQFHLTWIYGGEEKIPIDLDFMTTSLTVFFGMDLFFMLSGFLIGSILLRSLETQGSQQVGRFYLRRAFRTFPPYYFVLTLLALTTVLTQAQRQNLPYEYLYATNFLWIRANEVVMGWGWSLGLEEQFYLGVPLLFFLLYRMRTARARFVLLAALWFSGLLVRVGIHLSHLQWSDDDFRRAVYFRTYTRYDTLIAGILLAYVHQEWREPVTRWLKDPFHRALLVVPSLGCLWLLMRPLLFGKEYERLMQVASWGTLTTLMYFPWLLLLLYTDSWISRTLSHPLFRKIATLGYGVYLVHIPVLNRVLVPIAWALARRHVPMAIVWPASLVAVMLLSLGFAYVLHLLIEKPSMWVRQKLAA